MSVLLVAPLDSLGVGVLTDLPYEEEGAARPGRGRTSTPQKASETVRMLCGLISDQQQVGTRCNRLQSDLQSFFF